ncbi:family 20 glycosylhydrolase [Capnocytophaga cynodegmi]|uniref:beta-N-acetylhexosaminidase n=1 Tax=Capnocytophaga cynodegmi TaxID=28189 RepID=A0A0B7H871_9FLAO|nr:family 20 glycosylhydrolase [Capnocytophaga cynodegmi]CEN34132.1 Glycosyl hydrolase family 20, catalytic domain protein [Capnocytophaga cynodegmi]CEN37853.1 Glycosyl hydrolase family 20, catalytic domain protein [Capnocytophaga cynodegmi]
MKKYILFFLLAFNTICYGGIDHLLPKPQQIEPNGQAFHIQKIRLETPVLQKQWQKFISEMGGEISSSSGQIIEVKIVKDIPEAKINKNEAYTLLVSKQKIQIEAITEKGVYWAIQTLRQLKSSKGENSYFEGCSIVDYPTFRIRGFMQDVGRTFISLEELKQEISILSQYKINVFHWHLTENQGWRLESKRYPVLNDSLSYERMHSKFYTLDEVKELVYFCKQHNVLLIPEIDMPGHSLAFRKAFKCDMQTEKGMQILKELIDEMLPYFDVPYFHIGTDEVEFTNPNFVPEMVRFIRERGKKVISWNPGWNYKTGEIDMTQLWSYRGKAQKGIPAIDSRLHYINHFDAFADLVALYNSRILNVEKGDDDHAGSIIAIWHDRFITNEREIIIQNNFYPSMLALAERSWIGGGLEYFDDKGTNLFSEKDENFIAFQNFEHRMLWHKKQYFSNLPFAYVKQTHIKWRITDAFPNEGNLLKVFPPEKENFAKNYLYNGKNYSTKEVFGSGVYLRHVWGNIVKSFYENPQPNHTTYAYTYVYSPKKQIVGLWATTQNYSRSEKDLPPPQGKWDYKESKIWINENEILPPKWASSHKEKSNEIPLTNENFEVRSPIPITLKKGWNKILLKLPIEKFSTNEIRLVKWHFNFAFVTLDGKREIDGLIFRTEGLSQIKSAL